MTAIRQDDVTTNRTAASASGGMLGRRCGRAERVGGILSCRFGRRMGQRKKEREGPGLSLKLPPLAQPTQQPTNNSTNNGVGILEEIRPRRNVGGGRLPVVLGGNLIHKKLNAKIHFVAVDGHQTTKRHTTINQKNAGVMGEGNERTRDRRGSQGGDVL